LNFEDGSSRGAQINANTPLVSLRPLAVSFATIGVDRGKALGAGVQVGTDPRFPLTTFAVAIPLCGGQTAKLAGKKLAMKVFYNAQAGDTSYMTIDTTPEANVQQRPDPTPGNGGWFIYEGTFSGTEDAATLQIDFRARASTATTVNFWIDDITITD
jgi:hypothetical protein